MLREHQVAVAVGGGLLTNTPSLDTTTTPSGEITQRKAVQTYQLSFPDRYERSVVPGITESRPWLKLKMILFAYVSSSRVHFPLRKPIPGTPTLLPDDRISAESRGRPPVARLD